MALLGLVYRDQLFPRQSYRQTFDLLIERMPEKQACKLMVELLALAHDRGCEAELADQLQLGLDAGKLPNMQRLNALFAPDPAAIPGVVVQLAPLSSYEVLLASDEMGDAA
jgi:hypothetical protein